MLTPVFSMQRPVMNASRLKDIFADPNRMNSLLVVVAFLCVNSCSKGQQAGQPSVKRVEFRSELIDGPRAIGEVGDWLLENDYARFIVQDEGYSRGFGMFGGSLIDADIQRHSRESSASEVGPGHDNFGELCPSFFLQALEPQDVRDPNAPEGELGQLLPAIEIEEDGQKGAAVLVVRGYGNDFLAMTQLVNEVVLGDNRAEPNLLFETRYRLRNDGPYLEIESKVQNISPNASEITWDGASALGIDLTTAFGDIALFGAGNEVFAPGEAGFNLRYTLENIYASGQIQSPTLPGIAVPFIASTNPEVSYGLVGVPSANNYALNSSHFPDADERSLHIPFIASAFTGVFYTVPTRLAANDRQVGGADEYTYKRLFVVGDGDIAAVSDFMLEHYEVGAHTLSGQVRERVSGVPLKGVSVVVRDEAGRFVTQVHTEAEGNYTVLLAPGTYTLQVVNEPRSLGPLATVQVSQATQQNLIAPQAASLHAIVRDASGLPLNAKIQLIGVTPSDTIGQDKREFLFDLGVGQHWRVDDLVPDSADPSTRRYVENHTYTDGQGIATLTGRPGSYVVVVSHGAEYSTHSLPVTLIEGEVQELEFKLHHVAPTEGYLASDFHVHSQFSLDSSLEIPERLLSYVGEGLEFVVSTDHNYVVDYEPMIEHLKVDQEIASAVGLELTTIDRGHFNAYPVHFGTGALSQPLDGEYVGNTLGARTHGSIVWNEANTGFVFTSLRRLGLRPEGDAGCRFENLLTPELCRGEGESVLVQVNHPRDGILGYFDQFGLNQVSGDIEGPSGIFAPNVSTNPEYGASAFSWDFDVIEVFNGKQFLFLHNARVPEGVFVDPVSCCPLTPGQVIYDNPAFACNAAQRDCTCTASDTSAQVAQGHCDSIQPAFPGNLDDWYMLLRHGRKIIGTANSDSHGLEAEPGAPRTYVHFDVDHPSDVDARELVPSFERGNIYGTNGPTIDLRVGGAAIGSTINASSGAVLVEVGVRGPKWVHVDSVDILVNGAVVHSESVSVDYAGLNEESGWAFNFQHSVAITQDSFITVEAHGNDSLFPVVVPADQAPVQFNEVVGAIGGAFGGAFGSSVSIGPSWVTQATPFAFTNPVWVDANGDGVWTPLTPLANMKESTSSRRLEDPHHSTMHTHMNGSHFTNTSLEHHSNGGWTAPNGGHTNSTLAQPLSQKEAAMLRRIPKWLVPVHHRKDIRPVLLQFTRHAH